MNCFLHDIEGFLIDHVDTFRWYIQVQCGSDENYACKNSGLIDKDYRLL
jgi:hypothetical protein